MTEMVVFDHYLKNYSFNPIQTLCVHLFGKCSELIRFFTMLAKVWPSSGHKMTQIGGFRPLSEKEFMHWLEGSSQIGHGPNLAFLVTISVFLDHG